MLTHEQRLRACINGDPVDRLPVALWRHFPVDDQDPVTFSDAVVNFQKIYDFDFVKVTPASTFMVKDYGVVDEWKGNPEGTRAITNFPFQDLSDLGHLEPLEVCKGNLSSQLEALSKIRNKLPPGTPVIQTLFEPLSQAKHLLGKEKIIPLLQSHPAIVKSLLDKLAENTNRFLEECQKIGIDGVFYAVQYAQKNLLALDELNNFVLPYIKEVIDKASQMWLNILHIHGKDVYFDELSSFPFAVINWHDQETFPSLSIARSISNAGFCGGLRQWDSLAYGTPELIYSESQSAIQQSGKKKFILGTGCVLPIIAPHGNIMAARKVVEEKIFP